MFCLELLCICMLYYMNLFSMVFHFTADDDPMQLKPNIDNVSRFHIICCYLTETCWASCRILKYINSANLSSVKWCLLTNNVIYRHAVKLSLTYVRGDRVIQIHTFYLWHILSYNFSQISDSAWDFTLFYVLTKDTV